MARSFRFDASTLIALGLAACGGGGGGPTTGPDVDFSPTASTSLSGNVTYKSVTIPAGVTITATSDLVLTVVNNMTLSGTLSGNCVAITLKVTGVFNNAGGTLNNSCADDPDAGAPGLLVIGAGGIIANGGESVSSGNFRMTNDPAQTLTTAPGAVSPEAVAAHGEHASAGSVGCSYTNYTTRFIPQSRAKGKNGTPKGDDGKDGYFKDLGPCIGGANISGLTMSGQKGGDGGDGTVTNSATQAVGGKGGNAGAMLITAPSGDITFSGTNTINLPNGGTGGAANGTGATPGGAGNASGGDGGDAQPTGFNGSPLTIQATTGSIINNGTLNINGGRGGDGGPGTATGGAGSNGATGGPGGTVTAFGGTGGKSADKRLVASGSVGGTGVINVGGGDGGTGGAATANGGNGGNGSPGAGGNGGGMLARGGTGGNAQLKNQNGAITGHGGVGGNATYHAGLGGNGGDNCPNTGGAGGMGGSASGGGGTAGTPAPAGTPQVKAIVAGNGGNGGMGLGPFGPKGVNGPPADNDGNSFKDGNPGGPCPASVSATVTPPTQNVTQGGTGSVHVVITRTNFNGAVTVTVKDQSGAVVGTGSIGAGGTSTDVSFPVPAGAGTGSKTYTVEVSGTGITTVTQPFTVVIAQATGTAVTGQYCGGTKQAIGIWFSDDAAASWTQGTLTGQSFSHTFPGTKAGLALLINTGSGFETDVYQFGSTELAFEMTDLCSSSTVGTNTVNGTVRGMVAGQHAFTTLGNSSAFVNANGSADVPFQWLNVKPGTLANIWALMDVSNTPLKTGISRGNVVPTGSTILIDYATSMTPDSRTVSASNVGTDSPFLASFYWTPTSLATLFQASSASATLYNLANAQHQSGELFGVEAGASATGDFRFVVSYSNTFSNQTLDLPNKITFAQSCLSSGSPVRFQVSGTVAATLSQFFFVNASQGTRSVNIYETSTFNDGSASYAIAVPSLPGYPAADGIQAGSSFSLSKTAEGATGGSAFGTPVSGELLSAAQHSTTASCP